MTKPKQGRPELPESERRVQVAYRVKPIIAKYLRESGKARVVLEGLVERSRDFKQWEKNK